MNVKFHDTNRGFTRGEFKDGNDMECSIRESSASREERLIWLGPNKIEMKEFMAGKGWIDRPEFDEFETEHHYSANTLMHLTQSQVKMLLPTLQHFAKTGDLLNAIENKIDSSQPTTDDQEWGQKS